MDSTYVHSFDLVSRCDLFLITCFNIWITVIDVWVRRKDINAYYITSNIACVLDHMFIATLLIFVITMFQYPYHFKEHGICMTGLYWITGNWLLDLQNHAKILKFKSNCEFSSAFVAGNGTIVKQNIDTLLCHSN